MTAAPADRSPPLPRPESTAGAWWGLLLVVYGSGSGLFAGLAAAQQYVLDSLLEAALLKVQQQRSEGGLGPALGDLVDELAQLTGRLSAPIYADAAVTGALALLCVVCGFGVMRRSPVARRWAGAFACLKVGATAWWVYALFTSILPTARLTLEKLEEFFRIAGSQAGQQLDTFEGAARLAEPTAMVLAGAAILPLLLVLYAVFGRPTRVWCAPPGQKSGFASPDAAR